MTLKRIFAVGGIFLLATAGWWMLGTATYVRSAIRSDSLGGKVEQLWGSSIGQTAPSFELRIPGTDRVRHLSPSRNQVEVSLHLQQRRKGLIWYPAFECEFKGVYTIDNPEMVSQNVQFHFQFPSSTATYDNFHLLFGKRVISGSVDLENGIREILEVPAGGSETVEIVYKTRGLRFWSYFPDNQYGQVKGFRLQVNTDFSQVDFPEGSLAPGELAINADGTRMCWEAENLITRQHIAVEMPEKLNPGPLASRITYFAPVCLLFFFVVIGLINILYRVEIHPMHYLFVAAGFFAFHLLFAYLVDLVNIHLSFIIASVVSLLLVNCYMAAALKHRYPWKVSCTCQLLYLVLFSYSFFIKGMTGITVTVGSVITLAVLMGVTARLDWNQVFSRKQKYPISSEECPISNP